MQTRLMLSVGLKELVASRDAVGQVVDGFEVRGGKLPRVEHGARAAVGSWHLPFLSSGAEAAALARRIHQALGVRRFVFHPQRDEQAARRTEEFIRRFLDEAGPGLSGFVEMMRKSRYPAPSVLAQMVLDLRHGGTGPGRIGVCLDTSHVGDLWRLPEVIEQLGPAMGHVHLSDVARRARGKLVRHQLPGEGIIQWEEVLPHLVRWYRGPITVEPHVAMDQTFPSRLERSVAMLRELLEPLFPAGNGLGAVSAQVSSSTRRDNPSGRH